MTTISTPATLQAEADNAEQFHAGAVVATAGGHFVHDTYTAFLAPLLPAFIARFGLSTTQAGALSVFYQWPSLIQPYIGYLADRSSLRYMLILAPAITGTLMSLLGIAPGYAVMTMLLLAAGVSSAGLHAVGPVLAGRLSGRNLGRGMSFWMVGGELGRTIGPLLVVSVVSLWGLEGMPWLMIGGWLASAALYVFLRGAAEAPRRGPAPRPWREALYAMRPLLVPLTALLITRFFLIVALSTFLPTFLNREGASFWSAGASLSVLQAAAVVGALAGGSLSDRFGRKIVLSTMTAAAPLLMFLFLSSRGWVQFPLLLLLGFTVMSGTPVIMALVQESYPQGRALANGIYMALNFLLTAVVTIAMGALGDLVGLRPAFIFSAAIFLVGLPLIRLLPAKLSEVA
ncbi:MAG: MFS transporter [Anaerolineae bacterium]|nr:MFS transporter [Anaerolineae bacterium]